MLAGAVAKRYANALYAAAKEKGALRRVEEDLALAAGVLGEDREIASFLAHPGIPVETKKQYVETALSDHVSPLVLNFLKVLFDKRRESFLGVIQKEFSRMCDREEGRIKARVQTAVALDPEERERLRATLASSLGKEVTVQASVNPGLIGGAWIQIGDRVFDGSVRGNLDRFRKRLQSHTGR
jgi:F-type H+-transporting ATPase subunit delta